MTWMNELRRDVQKTVKAHCASFTGSDGCLLCGTCMYYRDLLPGQENRCAWAEEAVLPNDSQVETQYHERLAAYLGTGETANVGTCRKCNRDFIKSSNRNVYCTKCREETAREAKTKRQRKYRQKSRKQGA